MMPSASDVDQLGVLLLAEAHTRRRAQRLWRAASVIAGIGLGLLWWPIGLAAFLLFQFLSYATYWHSVRLIEGQTGLSESEQAAHLAALQAPRR